MTCFLLYDTMSVMFFHIYTFMGLFGYDTWIVDYRNTTFICNDIISQFTAEIPWFVAI